MITLIFFRVRKFNEAKVVGVTAFFFVGPANLLSSLAQNIGLLMNKANIEESFGLMQENMKVI